MKKELPVWLVAVVVVVAIGLAVGAGLLATRPRVSDALKPPPPEPGVMDAIMAHKDKYDQQKKAP